MSVNKEKKDKGQKILQVNVKTRHNMLFKKNNIIQSFKKQLIFYKRQEKLEKGEDPNGTNIVISLILPW